MRVILIGAALLLTTCAPAFAAPEPAPQQQGGMSPEQQALYWHARYVVAQRQLLEANDAANGCPSSVIAAARALEGGAPGGPPGGPAAGTPPDHPMPDHPPPNPAAMRHIPPPAPAK